jgi:predicted glycosyltransferase involved in capsule biosynthesis
VCSSDLSRARNRGLAHLANRYVVLEDVDLVVDTDFHRRLLHLATIYIGERGLALLTVPVAYLSQSASAEVLVTADPVGLLDRFKADAVLPDPARVVGWVAASSVIVFERAAAYRVGGMATVYEGWGFEDFDFAIRLLATGSLPLPPDFWVHDACDYRDQIEWRGWRATMRLHGDLVAYHGLCAFHLHHPVEMTERSADRDRNRTIFLDRLEAFAGGRFDPPMIPGPDEPPLLETRPTEPIEPTRLWLSTLFDRYRTMDFVRRYSPRIADRIIEVRGIGFTKGLRPTTRKLRKLFRSPRTFAVDFWRKLRR